MYKVFNKKKNLVAVDQYGISLDEDQRTELQIVLQNDKWELKKKIGDKWIDYTIIAKYSQVPYSIAKSICILSESGSYDINVPDSSITNAQNVNISSFEFSTPIPDLLESEGKRNLKITKSGDWTGLKQNLPQISVNYNKDEVNAEIDEQFKEIGIDVKEEEPFEYPPTKSKDKNLGLIIGVTIACVVVVVVVIVVVIIVIKKKKLQDKSVSEDENNAEN